MCGEKLLICANGGLNPGSPPHVRGKVEPQTVKLFAVGITPACAGKRVKNSKGCAAGGDHPRMCGEKWLKPQWLFTNAGSPPHVRGKVKNTVAKNDARGITPACAGKSDATFSTDSMT